MTAAETDNRKLMMNVGTIYNTLGEANKAAAQLKQDRKIGCFRAASVRPKNGVGRTRYHVVQVYAYNPGGRIVGSDRGDGKSLWVSEGQVA